MVNQNINMCSEINTIKVKKAFTLVELLVWIWISVILMLSVWIFVSNWIWNILNSQKSLENSSDFIEFLWEVNTSINLLDKNFSFNSNSGVTKTSSWIIFKRWKEFSNWGFNYLWETNENLTYCLTWSENINTNHIFIKNFIPFWDYKNSLSYSWTTWYTSYQKEHIIKNNSGNIIIWKWIFWNEFEDWKSWTGIYLNNPTWLAKNWDILYISDTLNNRVLYYNTTTKKIFILLDENDWLNEPTWLYFNNNELYISNSANGEILKYSSLVKNSQTLNIVWINKSVSNFKISFFNQDWIFNINNLPNINDITFNNAIKWPTDTISKNNNEITYSFSWWTVNKNIQNITFKDNLNNFSNTWTYYAKLDIDNNIYTYFTQWDNDILTNLDNILEVHKENLEYPTEIWWTWVWDFKEYWKWSFSNLDFNKNYDYLLKIPIKASYSNLNNNLLNIKLEYYKKYDCYNLDNKISRSIILKKNLR
jgi:hypothetical protein